jgi:hypothetical protein
MFYTICIDNTYTTYPHFKNTKNLHNLIFITQIKLVEIKLTINDKTKL